MNRPATKHYPLTVFFDGECPICAREIALVQRLNRRGRLEFVDFAQPSYDPDANRLSRDELGHVIHARWRDGSTISGVDVFREVWTAVGFGLFSRLSRLPVINDLLLRGYDWFARNRLRLTGRAATAQAEAGRASSCPRCARVR